MESGDNGAGLGDCSPGTLVWVRRRNGSWWPGKIVGAEELSSSHLMSPRSGTPVKLLGREDASVDWYNLEKSRRVKPFRCGEFDECIERVESSMGMPPKKREKYARREDAVLHALELEKQMLENGIGKSGHPSNGKLSDPLGRESVKASECLPHGNGIHTQSKSSSTILDSSSEHKSAVHTLCVQKVEKRTALTVTTGTDNSEAVTQLRSLQDFGHGARPLKRKHSSLTVMNGSGNHEHDGKARPSNTVHTSSEALSGRRKISNEVLRGESFPRMLDYHSPIAQILQSSPKLSVDQPSQLENDNVPLLVSGVEQNGVKHFVRRKKVNGLPCQADGASYDKQLSHNQLAVFPSHSEERHNPFPHVSSEENTSTSSEDTETDSSRTNSLELEVDGEMMALSDVAAVTEFESKFMGNYEDHQLQHGSMSKEEPDDSAHSSDMSHDYVLPDVGVSKWKHKGKRNIRGLSNRSTKRNSQGLDEAEHNGLEDSDMLVTNYRDRGEFDGEEYLLNSKASYDDGLDQNNDISHNMVIWEDLAWGDHHAQKNSWEDSNNYFDPFLGGRYKFGGRMKSMLLDVDVKVQAGYKRQGVPMISLMSKFNGQAIIGHPIQVEALDNGSLEIFLPEANGICLETLEDDKALTPTWRTARRSANRRVPRPHPSTKMAGEELTDHLMMTSRPSSERKPSRKPQKKVSLSSSNQKVKSLSSIGSEHKRRNGLDHETNDCETNGLLMKGESGPTVVACIPVKLVFSRLLRR